MTLGHCLLLSAALFALGAFGLVTRRNLIAVLISIELMVNAGIINFVAFARFGNGDAMAGALFPLFVMAISACEMALALGVVMALRRHRTQIDIDEMQALNG
jgi:NADH:ubiquinone oxidoreductase subunit K